MNLERFDACQGIYGAQEARGHVLIHELRPIQVLYVTVHIHLHTHLNINTRGGNGQ